MRRTNQLRSASRKRVRRKPNPHTASGQRSWVQIAVGLRQTVLSAKRALAIVRAAVWYTNTRSYLRPFQSAHQNVIQPKWR